MMPWPKEGPSGSKCDLWSSLVRASGEPKTGPVKKLAPSVPTSVADQNSSLGLFFVTERQDGKCCEATCNAWGFVAKPLGPQYPTRSALRSGLRMTWIVSTSPSSLVSTGINLWFLHWSNQTDLATHHRQQNCWPGIQGEGESDQVPVRSGSGFHLAFLSRAWTGVTSRITQLQTTSWTPTQTSVTYTWQIIAQGWTPGLQGSSGLKPWTSIMRCSGTRASWSCPFLKRPQGGQPGDRGGWKWCWKRDVPKWKKASNSDFSGSNC